MGNDGVSALLPDNDGGGGDDPTPSFAYTKAFERAFPYYLAIGMGAGEFWEGDVTLAKAYRKAWELRREMKNQELWLQGAYIYDAVSRLYPLLNPMTKKGTKPEPYPESPYPLSGRKTEAKTREEKADNKAKAMMEIFMVNINRRFEQKGGEGDGGER